MKPIQSIRVRTTKRLSCAVPCVSHSTMNDHVPISVPSVNAPIYAFIANYFAPIAADPVVKTVSCNAKHAAYHAVLIAKVEVPTAAMCANDVHPKSSKSRK